MGMMNSGPMILARTRILDSQPDTHGIEPVSGGSDMNILLLGTPSSQSQRLSDTPSLRDDNIPQAHSHRPLSRPSLEGGDVVGIYRGLTWEIDLATAQKTPVESKRPLEVPESPDVLDGDDSLSLGEELPASNMETWLVTAEWDVVFRR